MKSRLGFDELNRLFRYEDGHLYWRVDRHCVKAGARVSTIDRQGYVVATHLGVQYMVHRVVWLLHHGVWPQGQIDHVNGIRHDNRIENLRDCTVAQNAMNRAPKRGHLKGVTRHPGTGKFMAQIQGGYIGLYATQEEAARAYDREAVRRFGSFARTNFGSTA